MGGKTELASSPSMEKTAQWLALRSTSGMRGLLIVTLAMACTVVAILSTDFLTLFCPSSSRSLPSSSEVMYLGYASSPSSTSSSSPTSNGQNNLNKEMKSSKIDDYGFSESITTDDHNLESQNTNKDQLVTSSVCHYQVGRWVKGKNKPLYSGKSCKKWLSSMWACREMPGRPTFEYETYKWQPDGCDLPEFTSEGFLSRMRNKVIAFVGDSIGRQQFQSMMCMLTEGDDNALVDDVSRQFGLVKPKGALRADGTAMRFVKTNTTVLYYWSATLCNIQPLNKTDPKTEYAMHLDRPAGFIQKYLKWIDVLVLNTGHHWNRGKMNANRWVMYVDGKVNTNRKYARDFNAARNFTLHKVVEWLHKQKAINATRAEVYIRTLSPRHFFNGEWDSGGRCDNNMVPVEDKNITGRVAIDPDVESAVSGTSVNVLNITYVSQFRDEAHISKYRPNMGGQDCLHWCLPGVPDVWNELLYANLLLKGSDE